MTKKRKITFVSRLHGFTQIESKNSVFLAPMLCVGVYTRSFVIIYRGLQVVMMVDHLNDFTCEFERIDAQFDIFER
jgi:hypothetical protein